MASLRAAVFLLVLAFVLATSPAELLAQLKTSGCCGASSENAVGKGLRWLAARQHPDGSWPALREGSAGPQALALPATQSTGLVLLAYLGAGQTHKEGMYK